jgi:hypothetical protein
MTGREPQWSPGPLSLRAGPARGGGNAPGPSRGFPPRFPHRECCGDCRREKQAGHHEHGHGESVQVRGFQCPAKKPATRAAALLKPDAAPVWASDTSRAVAVTDGITSTIPTPSNTVPGRIAAA